LGVKQTASTVDNRATSGASFRNLLDDPLFCPPRNGLASKRYCDNRFVVFGAQGACCSMEHANYIADRGGKILWLNRDLRSAAVSQLNQSTTQFKNALTALGRDAISGYNRPIALSLDVNAINLVELPAQGNPTPYGLSVEEISEMAMIAGSDPNVAYFDISEINIDIEEAHSSRVIVNFLYKFALGKYQYHNNCCLIILMIILI
jgi:arginase family enzyme